MNDNYKVILDLLIRKMITGEEAETYIRLVDNGFSMEYTGSYKTENEIDIDIVFHKTKIVKVK